MGKKASNRTFDSIFKELSVITLPEFKGTRIMMMPVIIGDSSSIPEFISEWRKTFEEISAMADEKTYGQVGYLTIDEKNLAPGKTHRRQGLHVDGVYEGEVNSKKEDPPSRFTGGSWGSVGNGMLTVANVEGCRAWKQPMYGWPGNNGECDHLKDQLKDEDATIFKPNTVYWLDGLCVHESMLQTKPVDRQFVRLSLPSEGPWFENYTANPLGVKPSGLILPKRVIA